MRNNIIFMVYFGWAFTCFGFSSCVIIPFRTRPWPWSSVIWSYHYRLLRRDLFHYPTVSQKKSTLVYFAHAGIDRFFRIAPGIVVPEMICMFCCHPAPLFSKAVFKFCSQYFYWVELIILGKMIRRVYNQQQLAIWKGKGKAWADFLKHRSTACLFNSLILS